MAYNPHLYEQLLVAGPIEQRETAENLINGMRGTIGDANDTYWKFVQDILRVELHDNVPDTATGIIPGVFSTDDAAGMVRNIPRAKGYLDTIAKVGETMEVKSAIDVGTGPTSLWAVGIGVLYPRAEVRAIERNEKAAHCAKRVLQLFGLGNNRIVVRQGDVFDMDLDEATLGVTETFGPATTKEPGLRVCELLARKTKVTIPGEVQIFVQDVADKAITDNTQWQRTTSLDLSEPNPQVIGQVVQRGNGRRWLYAYSGFYTARGEPVIAEPDADPIAEPVSLGLLPDAPAGSVFEFTYPTGVQLWRNNVVIRQVG